MEPGLEDEAVEEDDDERRRRHHAHLAAGDCTDELALLMTLEMGKTIKESKAEIAYASEFFRWFAEEAVRIEGRYATAPNGAGRLLTMRQPVGPCYMITPWNFPMAMGTRKIGPAVAAGWMNMRSLNSLVTDSSAASSSWGSGTRIRSRAAMKSNR